MLFAKTSETEAERTPLTSRSCLRPITVDQADDVRRIEPRHVPAGSMLRRLDPHPFQCGLFIGSAKAASLLFGHAPIFAGPAAASCALASNEPAAKTASENPRIALPSPAVRKAPWQASLRESVLMLKFSISRTVRAPKSQLPGRRSRSKRRSVTSPPFDSTERQKTTHLRTASEGKNRLKHRRDRARRGIDQFGFTAPARQCAALLKTLIGVEDVPPASQRSCPRRDLAARTHPPRQRHKADACRYEAPASAG